MNTRNHGAGCGLRGLQTSTARECRGDEDDLSEVVASWRDRPQGNGVNSMRTVAWPGTRSALTRTSTTTVSMLLRNVKVALSLFSGI
jgi:hypothetical protein